MNRYYVTTAIPYVNGRPHVGHALKNVRGAEAEGIEVAEYVARMADGFVALGETLDLEFDHFIRTSSDPRHQPGVHAFWAACADRGDFYRKAYRGRYCVGCEVFYHPDELVDGRCGEHGTVPEEVEEENWFFRLSSYQDQLESLIADDVVLAELVVTCQEIGTHLTPFLPRAAALITRQCGGDVLPEPQPVFPRLQA